MFYMMTSLMNVNRSGKSQCKALLHHYTAWLNTVIIESCTTRLYKTALRDAFIAKVIQMDPKFALDKLFTVARKSKAQQSALWPLAI